MPFGKSNGSYIVPDVKKYILLLCSAITKNQKGEDSFSFSI